MGPCRTIEAKGRCWDLSELLAPNLTFRASLGAELLQKGRRHTCTDGVFWSSVDAMITSTDHGRDRIVRCGCYDC